MVSKYLFVFLVLALPVTGWGCSNSGDLQSTAVAETKSSPIVTSSISTTPAKTPLFIRKRSEAIPPDAVKIQPQDDVHPPILHSDEYETPVPLTGPVNTAGGEDSPFITADGKEFYIFFTPDVSIPPEKQLFDGATGIYRSVKNADGSWSEPERIILNNDIALDGAQYVNGDIMWFCSARPGYTGLQLFTAKLIDGTWQQWQYAGGQFPAGFEVGELHFSPDWNELYYHSGRAGGKGGYDIWVTRKAGGVWQEPENIAVVNSPETDGWPYLSPDGNELWFTRIYLGTPAIFRSIKVNGQWGEPELIVSQFAGEPAFDGEGNLYFCHHYFKDGVMLEADIYIARKK